MQCKHGYRYNTGDRCLPCPECSDEEAEWGDHYATLKGKGPDVPLIHPNFQVGDKVISSHHLDSSGVIVAIDGYNNPSGIGPANSALYCVRLAKGGCVIINGVLLTPAQE